MISQHIVVKDAGVRYGGPCSGKFFQHFCAPFLPWGDCSIRVSLSHDFTLVWFFLFILNAIQYIKRYCYNDQSMYTPIFKLFSYSVYPVAVTEV